MVSGTVGGYFVVIPELGIAYFTYIVGKDRIPLGTMGLDTPE